MNRPFEERTSDMQALTFEGMSGFLDTSCLHIFLAPERLKSDGLFTNHALMVSDQCPWSIRLRFEAQEAAFEGSLPLQLNECLEKVRRAIPMVQVSNRVCMFRRIPMRAVQEAIVNAVIHFDPETGDDIIVELSPDIVTISSPGGIYIPRTWKDITMTGARNMMLAEILMSKNLVRLKGKGFGIIESCYHTSGIIPCFLKGDDRFIVRLPSLDLKKGTTDTKDAVMSYLRGHGGATAAEISAGTMMSSHSVRKALGTLEEGGMIFTMGSGSKRRIFLMRPGEEERETVRPGLKE